MLDTYQMNPTTTINVEQNYYDLLSINDEEYNTDDATVITLNKSTDNPVYAANIPRMISNAAETTQHSTMEIHPMSINLPTKAKAWTSIIRANNLTQTPQAAMVFNKRRVTRAVKYAISDSGATGHFMVEGAPVINKQPAKKPIQIMMPDGSKIQSTHTCNLDIPWLPHAMTEAHIVPGLSHA